MAEMAHLHNKRKISTIDIMSHFGCSRNIVNGAALRYRGEEDEYRHIPHGLNKIGYKTKASK
jgi:hypothetical protein